MSLDALARPLENLPPQAKPQPPKPSIRSRDSATALPLGASVPRLCTPPLRELTPDTSYGFDVIDFARDVLNHPLDPWQEVAVIRAGELLEDGTPRFEKVLIIVARQNGKTELLVVLAAYWLFMECLPLILGTSTTHAMAQESWRKMINRVQATRALDPLRSQKKWYTTAAGKEECFTLDGSRYKIAASNEEGGRGLTVFRLILDELRQHHDYKAWNAAVPAGSAAPGFQVWAITNAGTDRSVVLNELRDSALKQIQNDNGAVDTDTCLLEWSAPEGSDPLDVHALAQANPNLGRRIKHKTLLGDAQRAVATGGEALSGFMTEHMCIRASGFDGAVDAARWDAGLIPGDLSNVDPSRIAYCFDVSPDQRHATLAAASVLADDRGRVEVVKTWEGLDAVSKLRKEIRAWTARRAPHTVAYFPNGPAATLVADLRARKDRLGWPPPNTKVVEITTEVASVCMGFSQEVDAGQVLHAGNNLLDDHVKGADKLWSGDVWRFSRKKGQGHCDAAYAVAGALHTARTMPKPLGKPRMFGVSGTGA